MKVLFWFSRLDLSNDLKCLIFFPFQKHFQNVLQGKIYKVRLGKKIVNIAVIPLDKLLSKSSECLMLSKWLPSVTRSWDIFNLTWNEIPLEQADIS